MEVGFGKTVNRDWALGAFGTAVVRCYPVGGIGVFNGQAMPFLEPDEGESRLFF